MKPPSNPNDPLLHALLEDAQVVADTAAMAVRSRRQRSRRLLRAGTIAAFLTAVVWLGLTHRFTQSERPAQMTGREGTPLATKIQFWPGFVKAYPSDSRSEDDGDLPVTTENERKLLSDLGDVPSLIVWNDSGKVSGVHVFEKSP